MEQAHRGALSVGRTRLDDRTYQYLNDTRADSRERGTYEKTDKWSWCYAWKIGVSRHTYNSQYVSDYNACACVQPRREFCLKSVGQKLDREADGDKQTYLCQRYTVGVNEGYEQQGRKIYRQCLRKITDVACKLCVFCVKLHK